ncbi:hypothetical protein DLP05_131 [Stenotrophomonas phage vB_SmaS_DLP_5]|uniref:Uncharacterized protein n=1 Tax=Stenotrophomonas phage vB_SmaS_DLP_5 TaxID=2044561 RepID=A0A2D2W356_9CAUD|nr:hypothetical protein FDJ07_gp090 [Stenotrophomonas phage vB_SmaS_DLP_5]ATS92416.1 hypothetical protein DLP05_131 [Stenotrophomonas phage vB_SmaS_DLP_5]
MGFTQGHHVLQWISDTIIVPNTHQKASIFRLLFAENR